ncbi:MAG: phosphate acyltransferase PlsX [Proteobacteria bacterium]|nr:phosphate acyltransferase PlsX [Pseudomonadota bacterium]
MIRIAIDAMGGDVGLETAVPAAIEIVRQRQDVTCILVGDEAQVNAVLKTYSLVASLRERLAVHHASQTVAMDEAPALALRKKKDSSMRVAINLVKLGQADACVSAGNTGALMATGRFVLRMIEGIDRPAICSALPRINGVTHLLDLGANVDTPPDGLLQFGLMGAAVASIVHNIDRPTVGLLNVGAEDVKGNDQVKKTTALFKDSDLNYIGFVEGDDIYLGDTDVIVCDGFVGNVALKSSEGVAKMMSAILKQEFKRNLLTKCSALAAKPVLDALKGRMDPGRFNGASLTGLNGIVVKSHGGADSAGFASAIKVAIKEVQAGMIDNIKSYLKK